MHHDDNDSLDTADAPPGTLDEVAEVRRELVRRGLVEFAGTFHEGKPRWRVTPFSLAVTDMAEAGDEEAAAFLELATYTDDQEEILRRGDALSTRLGVPWSPVRTAWSER
jgi:hypothetical protein